MGAKLSLLAQTSPSIGIFSYIDILDDVHYISQLNSSKFLKTCKAIDPNGEIVIKVFIKPNEEFAEQFKLILKGIQDQQIKLAKLSSVLNYSKIIDSERAIYLIRQHLKDNLYDRLSLRPYLNPIELKFITFQLLQVISEIHGLDIVHGDLKTENILINSWNWIIVTDFASLIKPVYLPEDNPNDFTFYFDTSKRRSCYLAPERFDSKLYSEMNNNNNNITTSTSSIQKKKFQVTKEMDIFSVGCCIAELFLEGVPLFNLSKLFKYKNGEFDPHQFLVDNIIGLDTSTKDEIKVDSETGDMFPNSTNTNTISKDDRKHICNLIMDMINIDPQKRLSCKQILIKYRGIFFPEYFYTFTYDYLKSLAILSTNIPTNDKLVTTYTLQDNFNNVLENCINKIYLNFGKICSKLGFPVSDCNDNLQINKSMFKYYNNSIKFNDDVCIKLNYFKNYCNHAQTVKDECSLLFLSFLLHSLRSCHFESTQIKCLKLITALSQFISDENKLDRIIPYLVNCFLNIESPNVQSLALLNVCQIMSSIEKLTSLNVNIFVDYLFPKIKNLLQRCNATTNINTPTTNSNSQYVKIVMANCLGDLVTIAERFEEMNSLNKPKTDETSILQSFTDLNIQNNSGKKLMKIVNDLTISLLTDNSVPVKISLLKNILPLCKFLGREKTNDIILSHLITYLNDRNYLLRMTLIETIPSIAIFLGPITVEQYILPLLIQSLVDSEECVIIGVLYGLNALCRVGLISKSVLYDLASTVTPLVLHPNYSIRNVTINIIYEISRQLSKAEIYCKLYPIIRLFFGFDVEFSLDLLIESCRQPISRTVFNLLCSWSLHASKSLFWKQTDTSSVDSFGNKIITFIDKDYVPQNYRRKNHLSNSNNRTVSNNTSMMHNIPQNGDWAGKNINFDSLSNLENIEAPLTTEDKLWINKFIAIGMKEKDLWKLEILRSYVIRYTNTWNQSPNRLNEQNKLYAYQHNTGNERFSIIPRNIFFDIKFITPNNILHTSQSYDIPQALQSMQRKTLFDENGTVQLQNGKTKLLDLINVNGSLLFQPHLLTTTTSNLNNIYVEYDSKLGLNGKSSTEENLENYMSTKRYIVENSYDGDNDTIKRFIKSCNIVPSLKEYKEFGLQSNVEHNRLDFEDPNEVFIANLSMNIDDSITTMITSQDKYSYLLTGSLHGIVTIWDILSITNGVKMTETINYNCGASITDMKFLPGFDTVVVSLSNGVIFCLRIISTIEEGVKKLVKLTRIRELNINNLSNIKSLTSNNNYIKRFSICPIEDTALIIALTNKLRILLFDIRDMSYLGSIQNPKQYGAISCFEVNPNDMVLIIGTMRGIISIWYLRFNILLNSFTFGDHSSISDVKLVPRLGPNHICITRGSSNPLFSIWDYSKMVCKFAALISDEVPSIQTYMAITKNLNQCKFEIDVNKGSISAVKVSGGSIIISQHKIQDLLCFNLLNFSKSKILFKNTFKYYEFAPVQVTANLTLLLIKPSKVESLEPNMHVLKETINHIELGQINNESLLFTASSQNIVSIYK